MSLRSKFILYLTCSHLSFAALAVYLALNNRIWLLAIEALLAISIIAGVKLVNSLFGTLDLINAGSEFISDSDFTTRFREVGQPELDGLIEVYNKMVDHLREERTRAQERNYFLDKVLTASPSGIITLDFDEKVALVNPSAQQMLQLPLPDLLGKQLRDLTTPIADELHRLNPGEARVLPLFGRRRVKCAKGQFLDRGFTRHFILMEELTEELRQSEKSAYEKLIRLMSHEVNNTVGSTNSLLHSCLNYKSQLAAADQADFEMALRVIINRTDQLNSFMRSFADVVRIGPPRKTPSDLRRMLEALALLFGPECARRKIVWRWNIESNLEPISLDQGQMEQVFVNIIKNGIEAIGEDGVITISLGVRAGRSYVVIEDSGCALTRDVRANLFTPFFSTKENGQGLGLTLVQEILEHHRFEFSLEGQPGSPTQFTIYF